MAGPAPLQTRWRGSPCSAAGTAAAAPYSVPQKNPAPGWSPGSPVHSPSESVGNHQIKGEGRGGEEDVRENMQRGWNRGERGGPPL